MGRAILRISIVLAIFHLHFTADSTTTILPLDSLSPGVCSADADDISSSSSLGISHAANADDILFASSLGISHESSSSRSKNAEDVIGDEHYPPERDLASHFSFRESVVLPSMMASVGSPAPPSPTKPLPEFAIDYGHEVVAHDKHEREIALTFDHRGGARWRSHVQFESGTFSVKIKTPEGDTSGLNTSFYLSSLEGDKSQDEIDFEFLGKDKGIVQTNYYTVGNGSREEIHQLGFDSSLAFHEYTIRWSPTMIEWSIDGGLVRTAEKDGDEAFPAKPMYLYASIWNAGDIDGGRWAGSYSGSHAPYVCRYRDVHIPVSHSRSTDF